MIVYLVTLFIVILFASLAEKSDYEPIGYPCIEKREHTNQTKYLFFIFSATLIFVACFRYRVGGDYMAYYTNGHYYEVNFANSIKTLNEPISHFIFWAVRHYTLDGAVPLIVFAFFTVLIYLRTIYKYCDRLKLAVLLFLFLGCWHTSFNAVRQCLASAIIFSGIGFIKDRRLFKYLIVVFIAFLVHKSAIIMLVPYFLTNRKISFKNVALLIVISIIALYSYEYILNFSEALFGVEYTETNTYVFRNVSILRTLVAIVPSVFFLILCSGKEKSDNETVLINFSIIHAVFMLIAMNSAYFARCGIYTAPFLILSFSELDKNTEGKNRGTIEFFILMLYLVFWIYEIAITPDLYIFDFIWNR